MVSVVLMGEWFCLVRCVLMWWKWCMNFRLVVWRVVFGLSFRWCVMLVIMNRRLLNFFLILVVCVGVWLGVVLCGLVGMVMFLSFVSFLCIFLNMGVSDG